MRHIPLIVAMSLLVSCGTSAQHHNITDVSRQQTIVLKNNDAGNVHRLTIWGTGDITGEAEISLILSQEVYKTERLSGKVQFTWDGDWYANDAQIVYQPKPETNGNITIKYDFGSL